MADRGERRLAELAGRTVVITGASRGLGAALAVGLAACGARVSICARRADRLAETADRVRDLGAACVAAEVDVTDPAGVAGWMARTVRELGPPSVLINNASILGPRTPLAEYPVDVWRHVLDVNLTGAFIVTNAVLPHLRAAGSGSIINVSSGAAVVPRVAWGAYSVAKHALEGWSMNLARELEDTGIRVNVVDPGAMRTGMRAEAYPEEDPAILPRPDDRAAVFLWLASDEATGVTGRRFRADGWNAPTVADGS